MEEEPSAVVVAEAAHPARGDGEAVDAAVAEGAASSAGGAIGPGVGSRSHGSVRVWPVQRGECGPELQRGGCRRCPY